jgi:hypothetical protein
MATRGSEAAVLTLMLSRISFMIYLDDKTLILSIRGHTIFIIEYLGTHAVHRECLCGNHFHTNKIPIILIFWFQCGLKYLILNFQSMQLVCF